MNTGSKPRSAAENQKQRAYKRRAVPFSGEAGPENADSPPLGSCAQREERIKISLKLIPFDLGKPEDWELFHGLCALYYPEVCSPEECREELEDLEDETLNAQLIGQTLQKENPYFVMKIVGAQGLIGFISVSFQAEGRRGVIRNLYIQPGDRGRGNGAQVMALAEDMLSALGAQQAQLCPVPAAEGFYRRLGYTLLHTGAQREPVYGKAIQPRPAERSGP